MPTLIAEIDVKLERADMLRRVVLPRDLDGLGNIVPPKRKPGLHLSGLLKYVATTSKITARLQEIADEEMPLRWAMGQAWEEFAASLYPDMIWQPGEVHEPLIMNCDGVGYEPRVEDNVIWEFKFNRAKKYKGADLIAKKWLWMMQGAGYCLGYGFSVAVWHVLSAFEFPDPIYTKYVVAFSDKDLNETARMIAMNRDDAVQEGYAEAA